MDKVSEEENPINEELELQLKTYIDMIFHEFRNVLSGQLYFQEKEISLKILGIFHEFLKNKLKGFSIENIGQMVS